MLILKDREVFGEQPECQNACSEDANGNGNFGQGWEVFDIAHEGRHVEERIGMIDGEPTDIEAVEDHAEQNDDRACQEGVGTCAILFYREPDDGCDDTYKNLCPKEDAHDAAGEEQTEFASDGEFAEFKQGIDAEDDGKGFRQFFEQVSLKPALEVAGTEGRLEDDH